MTVAPALCVLFRAGEDRYALLAAHVFKVVEPAQINRLPTLPREICGITQHRGRIVSVVDLARLFGQEAQATLGLDTRIIILDRRGRHLGLLVDAVEAIQVVRRPENSGELSALSQHQGGAINVLDTDRLIDRVESLSADM